MPGRRVDSHHRGRGGVLHPHRAATVGHLARPVTHRNRRPRDAVCPRIDANHVAEPSRRLRDPHAAATNGDADRDAAYANRRGHPIGRRIDPVHGAASLEARRHPDAPGTDGDVAVIANRRRGDPRHDATARGVHSNDGPGLGYPDRADRSPRGSTSSGRETWPSRSDSDTPPRGRHPRSDASSQARLRQLRRIRPRRLPRSAPRPSRRATDDGAPALVPPRSAPRLRSRGRVLSPLLF